MFKKPFNRQIGETRLCKDCGATFHTMKPHWSCKDCLNKKSKESQRKRAGCGKLTTGRFAGMEPKKPYPFSTKNDEASKRFRQIRKGLNNCWTKEERRTFYAERLEEITHNGILQWIMDRRDDETAKKRKQKSVNRTKKEYPDLRGHYEY
jgi:hypothetical protein